MAGSKPIKSIHGVENDKLPALFITNDGDIMRNGDLNSPSLFIGKLSVDVRLQKL